jgi:hypothetical protein
MKPMPEIEQPGPKAQALLRIIVDAISAGRIREGEPETFLSYSDALELLGRRAPRSRAGSRLQEAGLDELTDWTIKHNELPKIAALIVNKKTRMPGKGFPESHGYRADIDVHSRPFASIRVHSRPLASIHVHSRPFGVHSRFPRVPLAAFTTFTNEKESEHNL